MAHGRPAQVEIRSILLTLLLAGPALGLLALGPRARTAMPTDRTIVRYWANWTGVEGAAVQRLVRRFNETEGAAAGIWIDYNAMGDVDKRMLIAAAGGAPPDVAGLSDRFIASYAAQDALTPLDELARNAGVQLDEIKPVWLQLCRYRGKLYALPSTPFTIALFYNRAAFREAGLDPDRPPQTTAELNEYAIKLTRKNERGEIERLGFTMSPAMLGWWHWAWPYFFNGSLWNGQRFTYDTPETREALKWITDLRTTLGSDAVIKFEGAAGAIESAQNPFLSGQLAMILQGPWMANWARVYAPDLDYGVARFPGSHVRARPVLASTDILVIPRGAKHAREAMRFIAFMVRQENIEQLCKDHGKVSPYRTPLPSFFEGHPNPFVRTFDELASSPGAFGSPPMPSWSEAWTETLRVVETIVREPAQTARAVRMAQEKMDRVVADYDRMAARRRGGDEQR